MGKVFTWLFGAITGFVTGIMLVSYSLVFQPRQFVEMAKTFIDE